jgi:3' terminal RNA ribose 2'-O-methyltransferase Hen1
VGLVRGRGMADGLLDHYVNDRPYAASSFLSVAMARTLRTAMGGASKERPELAAADIPLEAVVAPLPARGGPKLVRALFEPLGWSVEVEPVEGAGSQSGASMRYVTLRLSGRARLGALLNHLYVLIPVLDDDKHYWVGEDEIEKLLAHGRGWLETHPERELIAERYLRHRRSLARMALARLMPDADEPEAVERSDAAEAVLERPIRLNDQRMDAVVEGLRASGAKSVADLGCGEGKLLARLVRERFVQRLIGTDAWARGLEFAARRLKLGQPGGPPEGRVTLLHSSLTYRDKRLAGTDAAVLVEVIEHLDPDRLPALERVVFGEIAAKTIVVTTPNAEYNVLFPNLARGAMRHPDHRFEWTRAQFRDWTKGIEDRFGYRAELRDIGHVDDVCGAPTQMAVFTR